MRFLLEYQTKHATVMLMESNVLDMCHRRVYQ